MAVRIIDYPILLKQSVVCDGAWRQNTNPTVRTLVNLMHDILAHRLADLVRHEALPLEEPVRADHIPMKVLLSFRSESNILTVELEVENYLLFNLSSHF